MLILDFIIELFLKLSVVVRAFIPAPGRGLMSEFKASLVYRVSSRTVRTIQRNPVSRKRKKKKKEKEEKEKKERKRERK